MPPPQCGHARHQSPWRAGPSDLEESRALCNRLRGWHGSTWRADHRYAPRWAPPTPSRPSWPKPEAVFHCQAATSRRVGGQSIDIVRLGNESPRIVTIVHVELGLFCLCCLLRVLEDCICLVGHSHAVVAEIIWNLDQQDELNQQPVSKTLTCRLPRQQQSRSWSSCLAPAPPCPS